MNLDLTQECTFPARFVIPSFKTILVVEDERMVREATCQVLRALDYSVFAAENAAAARKLFLDHSQDIDLLLCDAVLPDENGYVLARELCGGSRNLRIVLVSGYPQSELSESDLCEPTMSFLTKPYSADSLVAKIRSALERETFDATLMIHANESSRKLKKFSSEEGGSEQPAE